MPEKKTMTLNLSDAEMNVLAELSSERGVSKTALLRQALRLYQSVHHRLKNGDKLFFEDIDKRDKAELVVL